MHFETIHTDAQWCELLQLAPMLASYRHALPFERIKTDELHSFVLYNNDNQPLAAMSVGVQYYAKRLIKIANIRSGILFIAEPTEEIISTCLQYYIDWAKQHRISYIRISPWFRKNELYDKVLRQYKFKSTSPTVPTYYIDLTHEEDELMRRMHRQTRYEVRHGEREGIEVSTYDYQNEKEWQPLMDRFFELYSGVGQDRHFATLDKDKFLLQVTTMLRNDIATLFVSRYKGEIVNMSLCAHVGVAAYLFGALNRGFKQLEGCPSPGETAQWAMIRYMKQKGLKLYDMGFVPDAVPDPQSEFYPIWRFKYGFGGDFVPFMDSYGRSLNLLGKVYEWAKK